MKKFRLFLNPITDAEKWINKISKEGYRVKNIKSHTFEFEKTDKKYKYITQYIGYLSNKERLDYEKFLSDLGYSYFNIPINMLKISYGSLKIRPYAKMKGIVATSRGMFNKEILLIGKEDDGKEFKIYSNRDEEIKYLKYIRNTYLYGFLIMAAVLIYAFIYSKKSSLDIGNSFLLILLLIVYVLFMINYGYNMIKYSKLIKR